jgi:hypothetical protein
MKKNLLYTLVVIFFVIVLVSCVKFIKELNSSNISSQKQTNPSTRQKTVVLKGKDLKGAELTAVDEQGKKINFEIRDVELDPKDPSKETYLYTVYYLDKNNKRKNLCEPDAQNVAKAIPLTGSWNEAGAHIESEKMVTLSCTSGVLAKCVRFGYKPWQNKLGKNLRDFHQACTRMLRADYCGKGKSHTRNGTPVDVYDVLGIEEKTSNSGMVFEAAWGPEGATCINHPRWFETLSEISSECPEKFKKQIKEGKSCSTSETAKQNYPDSLVFNDSFVRKP